MGHVLSQKTSVESSVNVVAVSDSQGETSQYPVFHPVAVPLGKGLTLFHVCPIGFAPDRELGHVGDFEFTAGSIEGPLPVADDQAVSTPGCAQCIEKDPPPVTDIETVFSRVDEDDAPPRRVLPGFGIIPRPRGGAGAVRFEPALGAGKGGSPQKEGAKQEQGSAQRRLLC